MQGFTTIDLIILIVYLTGVLVIGLAFAKKDMEGKEFFRGDGTIPWWVTSVSIFATLLSPISFLSLVGNSYAGTWLLWFAQLGMLIAIPVTIRFFLPMYNRLNIDTAYEYLQMRFNDKGLRILGAVMFIIYQVGRMSIIMYLPSMVLANLMNVNVNILILLMGVVAIAYSYAGGIKSVLWTDFIQGCVLIAGVVFALIFLIFSINGGFGEIMGALGSGKFLSDTQHFIEPQIWKDSIFIILIGAGFNTFSSYISSQDIVQRFTTTNDIKKLNKMMLTNGALSIFVATVFFLIGTGLYVFYGQNPGLAQTAQQDQIFGSFIAYQLPIGITGILLAAIYAAAQSTLSTGINSVATSWTLDIQSMITKKELGFKLQTRIAKLISLLVGILAIIVAVVLANSDIKSSYEWFNGFMGLVLGVLGGTFVLGAFTKKTTNIGAYVAFFTSAIVVIFLKYNVAGVSIWSYSIISIGVSLVVGYIASAIHRAIAKDKIKSYDLRTTIFYKEDKKSEGDKE